MHTSKTGSQQQHTLTSKQPNLKHTSPLLSNREVGSPGLSRQMGVQAISLAVDIFYQLAVGSIALSSPQLLLVISRIGRPRSQEARGLRTPRPTSGETPPQHTPCSDISEGKKASLVLCTTCPIEGPSFLVVSPWTSHFRAIKHVTAKMRMMSGA